MKKILAAFLCLSLSALLCVTAFAEENKITITPSEKSVKAGDSVTLTIKIVGKNLKGNSAAFYVNPSDGFTVKSGKITRKDAILNAFDKNTNKAVSAYSGTVSFEGEFAQVTLIANDKAEGKQKIEIGVIIKPDDITLTNSITFDFSKGETGKVKEEEKSSNTSSISSSKTESKSSSKTSSTSSKNTSSAVSKDNSSSSSKDNSSSSSKENSEDKDSDTTGETIKTDDNARVNKGNILIIISSGLAAVLIIALAVVIILNKKKKTK